MIIFLFLFGLLCPCLGAHAQDMPAAGFQMPHFSFGSAASSSAEAKGNTQVVTVWGDHLEYLRDEDFILARGHVTVEQGDTRLFADEVQFQMKENWIEAQGHVVWQEGKQAIYADQIHFNLKTQQGKAEGIVYTQNPWLAAGQEVENQSDKEVLIHNATISTCLRERPHYRLGAKKIKVVLDQSISITHMVLYIGVVPVFYFPYFSRNLHDSRTPLLVKPGWDIYQGYNVHTIYNYFLSDSQFGNLEYDWMQKLGNGEGISHHYRMLGGQGDVSAFYTIDPNTGLAHWTGKFSHNQSLGQGQNLQANYDYVSDPNFNNVYGQNQVDPFQRISYLSYQSSQQGYAWNAKIQETISLSPTVGTLDYTNIVSQITLPAISYNLFSRPLIANTPLYANFSSSFSREYDLGSPQAMTPTGAIELGQINFLNQFNFSPNISYTWHLPRRNTLSSSFGFTQGFQRYDFDQGLGTIISTYNSSFDLQTRWLRRHPLTTDLIYSFARQLTHVELLPWAGITTSRLDFKMDYLPHKDFHLLLTDGLDLRPYEMDIFGQRLDLARFQATYTPPTFYNFSMDSTFSWPNAAFKTIDGSLNLTDRSQGGWQFSLSGSWVNNSLAFSPVTDPQAPPVLMPVSGLVVPNDIFYLSGTASFPVGPLWRVNLYGRYDMETGILQEESIGLWRDLHCWEAQVSMMKRLDGNWQYGFSINLKAFPQFKAGLPGTSNGYGVDPYTGAFAAR